MEPIYTEILGNIHSTAWHDRLHNAEVEWLELDRWTAQRSRLRVVGSRGNDFRIALNRHQRLLDGDIIAYDPASRRMAVVRIRLGRVMCISPEGAESSREELLQRAFELGHAIGNQHWPAVVRQGEIYLPLVVDRKVMESVMESHPIEGFRFDWREADEIIPYLSPHEIRRLFGGSEPHPHPHNECHREA